MGRLRKAATVRCICRGTSAALYGGVADHRTRHHLVEQLKHRSRQFALDTILLCRRFPHTIDGYVIARQLIKCATAVAANYRAACRSRSAAEFASKIGVVAEESDEAMFWLDMTIAAAILVDPEARRLLDEAGELTAIFTASRNTAKTNLARGARRPSP